MNLPQDQQNRLVLDPQIFLFIFFYNLNIHFVFSFSSPQIYLKRSVLVGLSVRIYVAVWAIFKKIGERNFFKLHYSYMEGFFYSVLFQVIVD